MNAELLQAIITVLAVLNPLGNAPIFAQLVADLPKPAQHAAAARAGIAVLAILAGSALVGEAVLNLFGISLDAFRIAGGVIVATMGFGMLNGEHSAMQSGPETEESVTESIVVPFAMPLCAGPGAISAVITISLAHGGGTVPLTALIASLVGALALYGVLLSIVALEKLVSPGAQRIFTRFMGLILVAMGFQFVMHGVKDFFFTG